MDSLIQESHFSFFAREIAFETVRGDLLLERPYLRNAVRVNLIPILPSCLHLLFPVFYPLFKWGG